MNRELLEIIACARNKQDSIYGLATVVSTKGSSYRQVGARMLVSEEGIEAGALTGGCIEDEIAVLARQVMRSGVSLRIPYDTQKRFGCNGAIEILVEPIARDVLRHWDKEIQRRRPFYLALPAEGSGKSRLILHEGERAADEILQKINPRIRLLIVGTGPEDAILKVMASTLGWEMTSGERIEDHETDHDLFTAALVKTHNYGRDFAALKTLLSEGLGYVGLIGSRARRDKLLGELLDHGLITWDNFHAPAGLDLGAESPEEIALSVIAEIQQVYGKGSGQPLRERKQPIHAGRIQLNTEAVL